MAFEAEDGEIRVAVVARVFVDVMRLHRFAALAAYAACRIGSEQDVRDEI
jgi:hypothetical protein